MVPFERAMEISYSLLLNYCSNHSAAICDRTSWTLKSAGCGSLRTSKIWEGRSWPM